MIEPRIYRILVPKAGTNKHDLASGSAVVAEQIGETHILHYEGNVYGACNLNHYEQKLLNAAGRKAEAYPTSAMLGLTNSELEEDFVEVGVFDYDECISNLRNRQFTGESDVECVRKAICWNQDKTTDLNSWAKQNL